MGFEWELMGVHSDKPDISPPFIEGFHRYGDISGWN